MDFSNSPRRKYKTQVFEKSFGFPKTQKKIWRLPQPPPGPQGDTRITRHGSTASCVTCDPLLVGIPYHGCLANQSLKSDPYPIHTLIRVCYYGSVRSFPVPCAHTAHTNSWHNMPKKKPYDDKKEPEVTPTKLSFANVDQRQTPAGSQHERSLRQIRERICLSRSRIEKSEEAA